MARDEQAMSAERLAEIRRVSDRFNGEAGSYAGTSHHPTRDSAMLGHAMPDMLAEVERRRAREAALVAVVRAVAEADNSDNSVCYQVCDYSIHGEWMIEHEAPCIVEQARALLAATADATEA